MKYVITARRNGRKIKRIAFSDQQAWTINNQLAREGCTDIGMREATKEDMATEEDILNHCKHEEPSNIYDAALKELFE